MLKVSRPGERALVALMLLFAIQLVDGSCGTKLTGLVSCASGQEASGQGTSAQDSNGSGSVWELLPGSTLGALRFQGGAPIERLREGTKLGEVLFSPSRSEKLVSVLEKVLESIDPQLPDALERYGIESSDLPLALAGETGAALLQAEESAPVDGCLVAWLNPAEDVAERLLEALELWLDDQAEDNEEEAIRVIEIAVAGIDVLNIQRTSYEFDVETDEDVLKYDNALIAEDDGALVVVASLNSIDEEDMDDHTSWLAERLEDLLDPRADAERLVDKLDQEIGEEFAVENDEDWLLEFAGDLEAIIAWSQRFISEDEAEEAETVMRMMGVDGLGTFMFRMTVGDQIMRQHGFLQWPEPRSGIPQVLEQQLAIVDPPAWVPSDVVTYTQLNFDLEKAFRIIKREVLKAFPQAEQPFEMVDGQAEAMLESSVEQVLASLGTTHYSIAFQPEFSVAEDLDEEVAELMQEPTAVVWQLEDEALWQRIMQVVGGFAPMANLKPTTEQGFRGYRVNHPQIDGGIVLGNGYLVVGVGPNALESTLASIKNPPSGSQAFRNSELFESAQRIFEMRPVTSIEITDGNRVSLAIRDGLEALSYQLDAINAEYDDLVDDEDGEGVTALFATALELLPTEDETEDILGVVITEFLAAEEGLIIHAVNELPAP